MNRQEKNPLIILYDESAVEHTVLPGKWAEAESEARKRPGTGRTQFVQVLAKVSAAFHQRPILTRVK
jgi:hypothetical protein